MAKIGTQGTAIFVETTAGGGTFTEITQVNSLADNPVAPPEIDVTDLQSLAREYLGGLRDNGTYSGNVWHDPTLTDHQLLASYAGVQDTPLWRIVLPNDLGYFEFNGYVQIFGTGSIGVDTALTSALTVRKTGPVSFTAGAPPP